MNQFSSILKRIALAITLFSSLLFTAAAQSSELINEQLKAYNTELGKYKFTNNEIQQLQSDIRASKSLLKDRKKEKKDASQALKDIQEIDRKNPSLGLDRKVQDAQTNNRQAFQNYQNAEQSLKKLQNKTLPLDKQLNDSIIVLNSLAREIEQLNDQAIARELEKRIAALNKTTTVEGHAEVGCGDESARKCQQRALRFAERNASEKGAIVVVQAVTHIDNFQLTKDQIKTDVQARLANVEVLEKGWVGDSTYQYRIRAQVTPIIGETLTTQIKASIAQESGVVVPPILSPGDASTSLGSSSTHQKTAAEQSFDELDRETRADITNNTDREKPRYNKQVAKNSKLPQSKEDSNFRTESWYTLWGLGLAGNAYPSALEDINSTLENDGADRLTLSADILGFYWPLNHSSLYGFLISATVDEFTLPNDDKMTLTQSRIALSTLNFLGKPIGKGFFLRGDIGVATANIKQDFTSSGVNIDEDSKAGLGILVGLGYSLPITNETRILFSLHYANNSIKFKDSGNVNTDINGQWSSATFNISGLW